MFYGTMGLPLAVAEPFPPMPALPAFADLPTLSVTDARAAPQAVISGKAAVQVFGLRLAALSPDLARRYGHSLGEGTVVLSAPDDAGWKLEIGNLREGDMILGVGSSRDYGRHIERARDPMKLLDMLQTYGEKSEERLVGIQWRCGVFHPAVKGEVRTERLRMKGMHWSELNKL